METENHTGTSADTPIGPGTRLNDIFEIDERIATGGMGEVFRGHNVTTDEAVAIKIVLGEFARDEKYSNLFFKEAKVLSSLNHPSIVRYQIFTIDRAIGRPYLVMEYIHGMSLAERLGTGPLSVAEVRRLTSKLADGLETAHAAGVVHRDLSPDNILLANNDVAQPKLIDFGIARTTQAGHKTFLAGEFAGRTNFASPEQFGLFGGNVEAASDVYSLALVVINALQGMPLDMNGSQYEMIEKRRRIPDLSSLDPDLKPIIEEMLVPDPANRHLTMADVANYFSGREPLANLKRSIAVPVDDPDDFWTKPIETASVTTPVERTPPVGSTAIVSKSDDAPPAAPELERRQQVPAAATIIAGAPMPAANAVMPVASAPMPPQSDAPAQEELPPQFEPPAIEATPIAWETQPIITARPTASPVRKRGRTWPYALAASILVLAAGGAGAYYSGALKNVVLPPELDVLLGRKSIAANDQVAQDDLPDLTAQPDKKRDHDASVKPMQTKTRPGITDVTENVPAKEKTKLAVDENATSQDNNKVAQSEQTSAVAKTQTTGKNDDGPTTEISSTTVTADKSTVEAGNPKVDAKPEADDTAKIGATLEASETAKIDAKPKTDNKHEPAVQTIHDQQTQVATTDEKTETTVTAQKTEPSSNDKAAETTTDDTDNSGGILPGDNTDKVAQNKLPTDNIDKQVNNLSAKPKTNDTVAHDTNTTVKMTEPLSSNASQQGFDQTAGKADNPVVQAPVVEHAKKDDKVVEEEIPSTTGKSANVKKTTDVEPVDQVALNTTEGKPANTTSHETVATADSQSKKNDTAETHVATTVANPVKTEDTNASDTNVDVLGGVLPSENDVKTTPSKVTANNAGQTVHDGAKPSDTTIANKVSPQTDHQADLTANKTSETADTETKPSDTTTGDNQSPVANDNSAAKLDKGAEQTEETTSKTDQATDASTKPSDTTTQNGQLPATNDNVENTAKADNSAQQVEQNSDNTGQTADTETKPLDSTADSGLPDETKTHVDNNNAADNSVKKQPDQSQSTEVAVGEPTTEIKHPEIAIDEGLAKRDSWVASFAGGDCFYARMTTNVASAAGIMAVSADSQPFYSLNDTFTSTFGLEPALRGVPIDKRQCAVTDLLRQLRQAPNEALDLKLVPADKVVGGEPLSSQLDGVTKPFMTVYLVDDDGKVYDLSKDVRKKDGSGIEFDYRTKEATSKVKTFKILLLIGSDKPLAVDFPRKSPLAKNIVPAIAKAINLQPAGVQYAYGFFKVVPKTN